MTTGGDSFYITTPIYYVNDKPHIGHAYTTILADVIARYHRRLGHPTYFLTGTDEHGQKVDDAAKERGIEPQAHCDEMVTAFTDVWKTLEISNDDFIRTTQERHTSVVKDILQDLFDREEIYLGDYEGWYCVHCERFWTEKDLVDGNCPNADCLRPTQKIVEKNYFFKMSNYQDWLIDHIKSNPDFILPKTRTNEVLGFLSKPLGDLSISRPKNRLSWGIPLPFDEDYVTYVWFDALINYISAIGFSRDDRTFNSWWPASIHLIGKDILTTHSVYWPTMLQAIGAPQPTSIVAHGWWLQGENKMSKSRGGAVSPLALIDEVGVDGVRYFLIREMRVGQDATFDNDIFKARYNGELADDLGNLASRTLSMVVKYLEGRVETAPIDHPVLEPLVEMCRNVATEVTGYIDSLDFPKYIEALLAICRRANKLIEDEKFWVLAKSGDDGDISRLTAGLWGILDTLRVVAAHLEPILPERTAELRRRLGLDLSFGDWQSELEIGKMRESGTVEIGSPLFPKME